MRAFEGGGCGQASKRTHVRSLSDCRGTGVEGNESKNVGGWGGPPVSASGAAPDGEHGRQGATATEQRTEPDRPLDANPRSSTPGARPRRKGARKSGQCFDR